jgi:ribosomal 50S subunit-associated protein YjgA (DUF615 family)
MRDVSTDMIGPIGYTLRSTVSEVTRRQSILIGTLLSTRDIHAIRDPVEMSEIAPHRNVDNYNSAFLSKAQRST